MNDSNSQNVVAFLMELGVISAGALIFSVVCTGWLIVGRIRGCLRLREPNSIRDFAFLFGAPVCAILISIIKAAEGACAMIIPGIDGDFILVADLKDVVTVCLVGIVCFVVGVASMILPSKSKGSPIA